MINKRSITGLLLMVLAVCGLIYWELYGREAVLTDPVLVAKEDIRPGTAVGPDDFLVMGIPKENKVEGAMNSEGYSFLHGKTASQYIHKNQQVLPDYFFKDDFYLKEGESIFVIKPEWISMRSSSIRRGDLVEVYLDHENRKLGIYRVAFVKDRDETEVRDPDVDLKNPLDRISGTKAVSHIEIIAGPGDYFAILEAVTGSTGAGLILIQKRSGGF